MKNVKKIIAAAVAVLMCTCANGCASADDSGAAYDTADTTYRETVAVNSEGERNADDTYPMTTPAMSLDIGDNVGVLQHADGNDRTGGATVNGGVVGVESDDEEFADETYPTAGDGISIVPWDSSVNYNSEEYNGVTENGYLPTYSNPLSTFSVDVDTASYANVRRMIGYGMDVKPEAVRIEEFINYFSYDYPEPTANDPFSVTTELSDCPWNDSAKLLLVGLKAKDIDMREREPSNLVFLIDVSGSMFSEDKLPLVQKSFTMLTENLDENDRISIVTYAGEDKVVLKGASGADKDRIIEAINGLEASGSTYGEAGINRAYELAEQYFIEGGNNRVLLATDGDLNVGLSTEEELTKLIEEKRETGVFLSVLGFGSGNIKDNRMEALADKGNGNYSYIDSELEARKVLVEEIAGTLYTVAKDVKIQVEFNPENVSGYRLIGYENRALADRDFDDDTKDAGEIGAGHTVTALYELILNDGSAYAPELKYQQQEEPVSYNNMYGEELLTVSLRYKQPDGDVSKLLAVPVTKEAYSEKMPANMTFAAAVAEFGMVLRNSAYKGNGDCGQILELLENYDYREDEYKNEFVYLVRTMDRRGY
ncbi:MAG: VWA domain-containing protein [Ruminococcus sp.]|nr:VWA domain-containing protein [Ruminococcus sp.]MCM1380522.1 VWA domain-containing protein [Muribaculaceae bacterium]MCM1478666.1 VWA domain-containing protein [Muribaculaceae bacterium]